MLETWFLVQCRRFSIKVEVFMSFFQILFIRKFFSLFIIFWFGMSFIRKQFTSFFRMLQRMFFCSRVSSFFCVRLVSVGVFLGVSSVLGLQEMISRGSFREFCISVVSIWVSVCGFEMVRIFWFLMVCLMVFCIFIRFFGKQQLFRRILVMFSIRFGWNRCVGLVRLQSSMDKIRVYFFIMGIQKEGWFLCRRFLNFVQFCIVRLSFFLFFLVGGQKVWGVGVRFLVSVSF